MPQERARPIISLNWWRRLGPGLITGAADDDPSGIATYSQAGTQFGVHMLWTVVLTYPLMTAVQSISARIGRVTGRGLAANLLTIFPRWLVAALVLLLFVANTINIGADLLAMAAAIQLLIAGPLILFAIAVAGVSLALQVFVPYHRYVHILKWLTLALFSYVATVFLLDIDWHTVAMALVMPELSWDSGTVTMIVAILGTTISPYLFFWQCAEEVEDEELAAKPPLLAAPHEAPGELRRIGWDSVVGMAASNIIAFFIMLTTAVTLHTANIGSVTTAAEAAEALRPIAGNLAFLLFSLGIVGTGLLALPVLAGSSAFAMGELRGWRTGLERKPREAQRFYGVIGAGFVLGLAIVFAPISPMQALYWSAVINGVVAVPVLAAILLVASRKEQLGPFVATRLQTWLGWGTFVAMVAATTAAILL